MSENKFLDPQSAAEANPYLGIDDGIEPTLQGPAVVSAQQNEPDAWATAKRKGAALGISPDVVSRNPAEVRKLELQRSLDNVRKTNPALADWLVRDDNLTLAQDDTESLGFIGRALEYPTEIASGFNRMIGAGISGLGDINDAAASKTMGYMRAIGLGKVAGALEAPILPAWANPSNAARAVGDTIVEQTVYETPEDRRNMGHDVAQGLGSLVGQVVATYVNPALAVTLTAGQGAEQQATRAEQEGASDADKSSAVLVGATITAATEKMGLDILLDRLPPAIKNKAAQWVADKVIAAGVEGTQEGLEQVAHNAVAQLTYAPDSPLLEGVGENATLGALVGGLARTVLTPGYRYNERRQQGQQENAQVDALSKMVQQSKLFERDPQKLADYIAGAKQVGASNVYIPAEDVTTLFQSAPEAEAAFEAAGIDTQSVQESLVLNADVSMPLEMYLTKIAPEYHAQLGKAARLSPDGLTDADVDVDDDQAEAVERFLSSVRDTPAEGEADMRVYNDVLGQLLGRYSRPDAEQMASVVNAFFRDGLGARAGIDPMELYGRYGLRIVEQVERRVMGRVEPEIDSMIERLRAGDIPTEDQAYGPTLAEFLSGPGIRSAENEPMSGEIRNLAENDRATRKGRKRLVREDDPQALTLDYAREAAAEAGYISPDSDLNDLLAALDGNARSEQNRDQSKSSVRDALAEMDTEISRLGLDVSKASNEEIRRALFGAVGTELDQVPPDVARGLRGETKLPTDPLFAEAVSNTPGAEITPDGLEIDLVRHQKPEQSGDTAVRTGVFYLPAGSKNARHYKGGAANPHYGGTEKVEGRTLLRRPLFVKGATGGKAPESALDAIKGKGAMKALERAIMGVVSDKGAMNRQESGLFEHRVEQFLEQNGADGSIAYELIRNSSNGNQLRYALQENIIAHAVRAAGYDSVVGYSKGKAGAAISEVFDVREVMNPTPDGDFEVHREFNQSAPQTDTAAFKAWFGDSKVVDEKGAPLRVFHGTTASFDSFSEETRGKVTRATSAQSGFFFASTARTAQSYADHGATVTPVEELVAAADAAGERGDWDEYDRLTNEAEALDASLIGDGRARGQSIVPAYLSIKNPLVIDAAGETPQGIGGIDPIIQRAKAAGHDGVIIRNFDDAAGLYDEIADHYIAFDPKQIKSATANSGNFDPTDPSILNQSNKSEPRRGFIQFGQDRQFTIGLTQARDMSTFLHEFGHFALEVMGDVAADAETSPEIAADYAALLSWLGVNSREEIGVEQHEKFARGFEKYLGEGTPPTPELAGAFARFRSWMKAIYKSLTSLNVELNDEVRGVMSRMLAGDAAIAQAEQATVAEPLFKEAGRAGMTEAQFAAYLELQARAHDEAETRIVSEAYNEVMRERKKWWREESSRIEAEVRAEFEAMPVYRAWFALSRNTEPNGTPLETPPVKLAKQYLVDRYGQDFLNKNLLRRQVYAVDGGVHGDMVAPVFGYETGPALVEALSNAPPLNQAIKAETASRMRDMHGDMRNDGTLPERAMKAVHGNRRLKVIEAEIAALSKLTGEIAMTATQARAWAQKQVAGKRIKDIVPYQYLRAERKAARESLRAANADKPVEALAAARRRLANAVMFDEANKARDRFQRRSKWIKAQTKKSTQENLGKAGVEFRDQVNAMLAALSVRPMTDGELARQKPLRAFVERLQDDGEDTAVAESVIALVDAGRAVAMPEMSVEAFDQAYEAIKSVKHIAGRVGKLLASEGNATVQQAAEEMAARAAESHPDRLPEALSRRDETLGTRAADRLRRLASELDRPENVIESLDGGESGPWHAYLWGPMNAAEDTAIGLRRRLGTMLRDLRKSMPAGFMQGLNEPMEVPNVGQVSRGTLLGIVLNTGNAQNLQRLRDGGIHVNGRPVQLTDDQVQAMRDLLTADEARYVQGLWDTVNSLWPDISALQTEMSGIPPEKVEAQAFAAGGMAMRGGYWPLAYDHSKSDIGERQSDDDALRIMMGQGFSRATTPKGHTKGRAQTVIAPLQLDFGTVMSRHLDNVMTDLSYRKAVKDTTRLLRNQGVKDAIIGRLGKGAYDTLKGSIAYAVSSNDAAAQAASAARQVISKVVANSAVSALAMRPDIALGNYGSALVQALDRVGVRSLLRGWWELQRGRGDLTEKISALSPFMAERIGMIDEDYRLELTKAQGKSGFGEAYRRVMFTLHRWADHDVTRAAWWGRYQEALEAGETQAESTRLADKLVRQTQTAGARKDVSAIERDPAFRESRIFMGPMFVIFGRLRAAAKGEGATGSVGLRSASILRQMFLAPALFMLLAGRWPEDDDDDGKIGAGEWGVWAAVNTLLFPMQTIPVVREVAGSVEAAVTGRPINPRAAPTAQAAAGLVKASKSIYGNLENYGDTGEIDYYDMTRDLVALAGPFTGAPAGQVRVTSRTIEAIQDNPDRDAAELARMALYGPPKP